MKLSFRLISLGLLLCVVVGCGKGSDAPGSAGAADKAKATDPAEKQKINYLKQYGLAYQNYQITMDAGPNKADDLADFMEKDEHLLKPLRSGEYALIWGAKLPDDKNGFKGAGDLVLGYVKDVPTKGGLVLMGDREVVQMTADEFKKAKMAKPTPKP